MARCLSQRCLLPLWFMATGSFETQKQHLSSPPAQVGCCCWCCCALPWSYTGTFLRAMPSMVAQTMVKQLISVVNESIWSVRCRTLLNRLGVRIGRPNVAMHRRRKLVKGEGVHLFLGQAPHRLGIELAIFSECSRPTASTRPLCWAESRCPAVRSRPPGAPAWGQRGSTLRCLCNRQRWRGVAGNNSVTAASSPSWPSVTMRSI
jgi:hypothetical protein